MPPNPKNDPICARFGCNEPKSEHGPTGCNGSLHKVDEETTNRLVCPVMCPEFLAAEVSTAPAPTDQHKAKYLDDQEKARIRAEKVQELPEVALVQPDEKAIANDLRIAKDNQAAKDAEVAEKRAREEAKNSLA